MANIPGGEGLLPSSVVLVETQSSGVSIPSGQRTSALMGEGLRVQKLVSSANGGGADGLNSSYSSTNGRDGRHFLLSSVPIQANRTVLFKNGVPLVGLEEVPSATAFSSFYDYRIDVTTGQIELQTAHLVDQGGSFYSKSTSNVGNGTISSLSLLDLNAPNETWIVRCTSIRRDGYGAPVDGYAKFIAQGSVSGILLDGYGNTISWQSNGTLTDNSILSFKVNEGTVKFQEGDAFTINVASGALSRGDSLVANYIAVSDLNDPEFFTDIDLLVAKHGTASLTNRLSLGAQLAFANNPPGVWTLQTAPSVPRRVSYILESSHSGGILATDLNFGLPLGVTPDANTNINFFITDPVTLTESQIIPNKVTFYNSTYTSSPTTFTLGGVAAYSYTVILDPTYEQITHQNDGVLTMVSSLTATVSSSSYLFTSSDAVATRKVRVVGTAGNSGVFDITSVTNGVALLTRSSGTFTTQSVIEFEVLDTTGQSARVLFTKDIGFSAGMKVRATVVDTRDASFFDAGWTAAYQALEVIETSIVVPLPSQTISAIFQEGRIHVETMSNIRNKKERNLFIGAINGLVPDNVIGTKQAAVEDIGVLEGIQGDTVTEILAGSVEDLADYGVQSAFGGTFRVVYHYPDQIIVQIGADRTIVDGFFIAAAHAGYLSGVSNVAIPSTRKVLAGFTILRNRMFRPIIQENIANAGICLLAPVTGGGLILWGRTTTASGFPEEEEISIVFERDAIAKQLRATMDGFIGNAESDTTQGSIAARANSALTSFIGRYITNFKDLKVVRDKVDPRQWNVSVKVQPIYGINFVFVRVAIGIQQ
jgi:hypothetical protein